MKSNTARAAESPVPAAGMLPADMCEHFGLAPAYRGDQLFFGLWSGAEGPRDVTPLPASLREKLAESVTFTETECVDHLEEKNGTSKISLRLHDGYLIETVLLTDAAGRKTVCMSTQAGCGMGCSFCMTGKLGFTRNLAPHEITEQLLHVRRLHGDISHIVYMGMGEPLLNLETVLKTVTLFTHPKSIHISRRKITLSTCGLIEPLKKFIESGAGIRLAVSLNSADQNTRERLMPVARENPLPELKKVLLDAQKQSGRRITFEYVLIPGINDSAGELDKLLSFVTGFSCLVNVIPYNRVEGLPYSIPSEKEVEAFTAGLEARAIPHSRRYRRGSAIAGACGQLGGMEDARRNM